MSRRIVFAVTAAAVIAAGAGAASAATGTSSSAPHVGTSVPSHQLCLLLYRDNPSPQHICLNW
jgi:hypothetical protein